jgi:Ca-activated chloride channel family protein
MFSKDRIKVKKSANIAVQREYNFNLNALSQEKAISLSDKGKNKEAVSELKKSAQKLREVGQEHNDEELLKRAEEMEVQADQVEKEGMTKKYRKILRTDSYQMKNQQMSK